MSLQSVLPLAIVLLAAYNLYVNKLGPALMVIGFGAVVFALSKSMILFAVILLVGAFQKQLTGLFRGRYVSYEQFKEIQEDFQVRDPVSIHTRIESVKTGEPLANKNELPPDYNILNSSAKKLNTVTGVLESASILDNSPLMGMEELGKEGVPGASIPSSAKARVLIYPPAEETVPAIQREAMNPKDNPYLQTGQDRLAEEVAQAQRGTDLYAPDSASFEGVGAGAGPAF
jgi:hypothetical protein